MATRIDIGFWPGGQDKILIAVRLLDGQVDVVASDTFKIGKPYAPPPASPQSKSNGQKVQVSGVAVGATSAMASGVVPTQVQSGARGFAVAWAADPAATMQALNVLGTAASDEMAAKGSVRVPYLLSTLRLLLDRDVGVAVLFATKLLDACRAYDKANAAKFDIAVKHLASIAKTFEVDPQDLRSAILEGSTRCAAFGTRQSGLVDAFMSALDTTLGQDEGSLASMVTSSDECIRLAQRRMAQLPQWPVFMLLPKRLLPAFGSILEAVRQEETGEVTQMPVSLVQALLNAEVSARTPVELRAIINTLPPSAVSRIIEESWAPDMTGDLETSIPMMALAIASEELSAGYSQTAAKAALCFGLNARRKSDAEVRKYAANMRSDAVPLAMSVLREIPCAGATAHTVAVFTAALKTRPEARQAMQMRVTGAAVSGWAQDYGGRPGGWYNVFMSIGAVLKRVGRMFVDAEVPVPEALPCTMGQDDADEDEYADVYWGGQ